jgi:hypothetical protein
MRALRIAAVAVLACATLAACGSGDSSDKPASSTSKHTESAAPDSTGTATGAARPRPLRAGERRVTVKMPSAYTPSAPTGVGTDDYRCFLLDPKVADDSFITGFNVLPGNPDVVHHVILFRVPPDMVAEAEKRDAETPGQGWTCFGTSGLGNDGSIDDAPWLGAWAPGGRERIYGKKLGEEFDAGSRVIMQVHYNLLVGAEPDISAAELRLTSDPATDVLVTRLVPAPVELPCRPGRGGDLCDREKALADVRARFGDGPGSLANGLHLLCGGGPPGPVQSCIREILAPETIRGVAGHMHLLGRSITIEVNPGTPRARTILDIPVWDFDDQGSHPVRPIKLERGDTVKVTCTHSQELRDALPAFETQREDRYILWGEGTTDEMCLGILLVTRP